MPLPTNNLSNLTNRFLSVPTGKDPLRNKTVQMGFIDILKKENPILSLYYNPDIKVERGGEAS